MEFIPTRRGGQKLLLDGREYHKRKVYATGNIFWKCTKRKCIGNITLSKENILIKKKDHDIDCKPNYEKNEISRKMCNLKSNICSNLDPIQKQFEEMICDLQDEGVDLLTDLPSFANVKSGLYNARHKALGVSQLHFQSAGEVTIPEKFKTFLLADYNCEDQRILVFCCPKNKSIVDKCQNFFLDGTFKSCPRPFTQIYSIHGQIPDTMKVVPLFFAFIHNKDEQTYKLLFDLIKKQVPNWNPLKMTLDYERSAMNAVEQVFPNTTVKGCYYHFSNSLFRKARKLGIKSNVQRRHVARCVSLARLPSKYFTSGYNYVMMKTPKGKAVQKFNEYLDNYWYNDICFMKKLFCYEEEIKTTNNLEGWHARLNRYVAQKNPSLAKVLGILKNETRLSRIKKQKQDTNYQEINEEIRSTIKDLQNKEITVGHCIEIIAPFKY